MMFQNFLVNKFKEGFSLFVLTLLLFLQGCDRDPFICANDISSLKEPTIHTAVLGPIRGANVQVLDLDNNRSIYKTVTGEFGSFQVDINDSLDDEKWLKVTISSGLDIDSDDDGDITEPFIALNGTLELLCKVKDLRDNNVSVNVFTTLASLYYTNNIQSIEDFLDSFAQSIFVESIDKYDGITYRDLFAYIPRKTPNTKFKNSTLYTTMLDAGIMNAILNNDDLFALLSPDTDGDSLDLWDELLHGTSPDLRDSDNDGFSDDFEIQEGLNPTAKDSDYDGIDDNNETLYGTSALNSDSDNDFLPDGVEIQNGTDPNNADENFNNILDGLEGDPFFHYQWYIKSLGDEIVNTAGVSTVVGNDLNIMDVYHKVLGSSHGTSSIIQVVDTGVELMHEDLDIDLDNSFNAVTHQHDPTPTSSVSKSDPQSPISIGHGTAVAGIIGAKTNNDVGIRGIVPRVKIAGSNWLEDQTLGELDRLWYSEFNDPNIVVSNNSWGTFYSKDDGFERILALGSEQLRDGKGRIYVFAAGNFREDHGNANLSYLSNNRYAITVAALNAQDTYAAYSSPGSNILVSAYGGERYYQGPTIFSTSLSGKSYYENELNGAKGTITVDEDSNRDYTYAMNGTSSATPMVSGSIALVLDACPSLTWRDVKWLIAFSASQIDTSNSSWVKNGAGLYFSVDYGFGKINPLKMIEKCRSGSFEHLSSMQQTSATINNLSMLIPDNNTTIINKITLTEDLQIEWIGLTIDTDHPFSGDLEVNLISPIGTKINIVMPNDVRFDGYNGGFRFGSVGFMGEYSKGEWSVEIIDRLTGDKGILKAISLEVVGHAS